MRRNWPPPHANNGKLPLQEESTDEEDESEYAIDAPPIVASHSKVFDPDADEHPELLAQMLSIVNVESGIHWVPVKKLGAGGFGTVLLWVKVNECGIIIDVSANSRVLYRLFVDLLMPE
jgi:hypothetical protein